MQQHYFFSSILSFSLPQWTRQLVKNEVRESLNNSSDESFSLGLGLGLGFG